MQIYSHFGDFLCTSELDVSVQRYENAFGIFSVSVARYIESRNPPNHQACLIRRQESSEVENFKSSCAEDRPEGSSKPAFEKEGWLGG